MSGIIMFTFACASLSMVDEAAYQYDSTTVLFRATISISGYGQRQLRVPWRSSTLHRRLIASYTTSYFYQWNLGTVLLKHCSVMQTLYFVFDVV